MSKEVAEIQKFVQSTGLSYTMHSAGTTIGESRAYVPARPSLLLDT